MDDIRIGPAVFDGPHFGSFDEAVSLKGEPFTITVRFGLTCGLCKAEFLATDKSTQLFITDESGEGTFIGHVCDQCTQKAWDTGQAP
jgi:alpha-D-ribose 1-methylphosphonate 5-phosphate C-P lyase